MRRPRHQRIVRGVVAALVLLASFTVVGARPAAAAPPAARVHAFGGAPAFPELVAVNKPVIGITATASGGGYWLVSSDGGIFGYGGAPFFGSPGGTRLNRPVVGMTVTPSGGGYWLVASDGGIFAYGDAAFYGSTGGVALNRPIVGMAATPTGNGYWLVASDGGIFAYGDAAFYGSTGGVALNKPVVGMASTANGLGYWLVAADGGIFGFGNGAGHGAVPGVANVGDVVGMARSAGGGGYLVAGRGGAVYAFGDAQFHGSTAVQAGRHVVGIAMSGTRYWLAEAEIPPRPSVGPPLPPSSGAGRRIVYCVSCQRVWYAESDGAVVKSNLVSGRAGTPRPGTYSVFSKSRVSSSGSVTMEYMVRFAHGRTLAIGFHAIPRTRSGAPIQSEAQLGTYRSHGCVRQADRDALYTWNFAPVGTKVVVTP